MKEPALEENALTAQVADGRLTIERRSTDPAPPGDVTVTDPDGKTRKLALTETAPGPRDHRRWRRPRRACGRSATGSAPPMPRPVPPIRWRSPICAPPPAWSASWRARRAAECTGWAALPPPDVPELRRTEPDRGASGSSWIGLERRHDHLVTGIAALALLPSWIALPLMLGLMVGAWRREGT